MTLALLLAVALSVSGTWLDMEHLSVEADVPAVTGTGLAVQWYLDAYRWSYETQGYELIDYAVINVPPGQAATISATLAIPRYRGPSDVWVVVAHDSPAGLYAQRWVWWPFADLFFDGFESGDPLAWSRAKGWDPAVVFRDGFEAGNTNRWERSVP